MLSVNFYVIHLDSLYYEIDEEDVNGVIIVPINNENDLVITLIVGYVFIYSANGGVAHYL